MDTVWLPEALLAGSGTEETDEAQLGENTLGGEGEEAVTGVVGLLASDGVGGFLVFTRSQSMTVQTCLASSSSIQGPSSPQHRVVRGEAVEWLFSEGSDSA